MEKVPAVYDSNQDDTLSATPEKQLLYSAKLCHPTHVVSEIISAYITSIITPVGDGLLRCNR